MLGIMLDVNDFIAWRKTKMKFKKMVCLSLAILLFAFNFYSGRVDALFGNAHFNIGKKVAEKLDASISEESKSAFLSGIVYADIGKFKFDKEAGVESDSDKFVSEMKKFAETEEEKWFVRGFEAHIFQDSETKKFLKDILGHEYSSYVVYVIDCGTLDSYFVKKSGVLHNDYLSKFNFGQITDGLDMADLSKKFNMTEEGLKKYATDVLSQYSEGLRKNNLIICDDLIKKTYESLGFETISLNDIHEQAGNLLGSTIIIPAFVGSKVQISDGLASKIEQKSEELADLCVSNFSDKAEEI